MTVKAPGPQPLLAWFWRRWADPLLTGLLLLTWLKVAWASDDAYIYFRSVEMWYAGYGPVYNPGWRVQAFTSPLWYWMLVWGRAWLNEVYLVAMAWSLVLSTWVWWNLRAWARYPSLRWLVGLTALSSIGFFDYTSSGLETPLVYATLVGLLAAWRAQNWTGAWWSFCLLALTRYDVAAFLAAPAGMVASHRLVRRHGWRPLVLGLVPLLAWLTFALVYYGTPLPNPVYAKVLAGLPREEVLRQGLLYYLAHLRLDPITLAGALVGIPLWWRLPQGWPWGLGLLVFTLYLVWVGGDFMLGRFLAPAFLVALAGLVWWWHQHSRPRTWALIWALGIAGYQLLMPYTPLTSSLWHWREWQPLYGVIDERSQYHRASSLITYAVYRLKKPHPVFPPYSWSQQGYTLRQGSLQVAVVYSIGMFGYWAGPEKTVVDLWALVDPFLARLPDADGRIWRPGHMERNLPQGYLLTLLSGQNHLQDPNLRQLWDRVHLVTQGPLWSLERWRAMPAFALGLYSAPRGNAP